MADNKPNCDLHRIKEAVCVDTNRVYDSCADKDCLADLRVYLTDCAQTIVNSALSVRYRNAEILNCIVEVERIPFNRGYYSVDLTFFIKVTLDAFSAPNCPPVPFEGLVTFDKKCILYGSEGNVKVYTSSFVAGGNDRQQPVGNTNPTAKVQCVEPVGLDAQLCDITDCCNTAGPAPVGLPAGIANCFDGCFTDAVPDKAVKVTLGIFTVIQLERDVQMLMPTYDFCVPTKECTNETESPCDAFKRICFPVDEFFPPNRCDMLNGNSAPQPGCSCC